MSPLDIMNLVLLCLCVFLMAFIFVNLRAIKRDAVPTQMLS